VIVVCAAGQGWPWVIYPGRFGKAICMGGVGPGLVPWASAATGSEVDVCAPADGIRRVKASANPSGVASNDVDAEPDGDGTSYAVAACSGTAGMWLAWHGVAQLRAHYEGQLWKIPRAFKAIVKSTAKAGQLDLATGCYGAGVLDAEAVLSAPLPVVT
jgi:hypothetical protein